MRTFPKNGSNITILQDKNPRVACSLEYEYLEKLYLECILTSKKKQWGSRKKTSFISNLISKKLTSIEVTQ